ncbi:MAG: hypothetical protein ABI855_18965 [Bacteroidota bacterium]
MKHTETEIKLQGFAALTKALGMVDAERFIALIQREPFDYTIWQQQLFEGKSLRELSKSAMQERKRKGDLRK